jgi:hypothetical protein
MFRVVNHFTPQYIPEDNSEHHTRRCENLKSHIINFNQYNLSIYIQDPHFFVATYCFVPPFHKAKFCGVPSQTIVKVG